MAPSEERAACRPAVTGHWLSHHCQGLGVGGEKTMVLETQCQRTLAESIRPGVLEAGLAQRSAGVGILVLPGPS